MQTNWLMEPVAPPTAGAPTCSQECRQLHPFQALPPALGPTRERPPLGGWGRLWGAWESRRCLKREISGGLEVCEQGGEKMRAVM